MSTIKVFLASSSELKDDRRAFEIFINRKKKQMNEELHSTIRAEHIERAEKAFLSALRAYRLLTNEYLHPQEKKLIKVLAQTEAGAVAIAAIPLTLVLAEISRLNRGKLMSCRERTRSRKFHF
jgi:hypothetical protein